MRNPIDSLESESLTATAKTYCRAIPIRAFFFWFLLKSSPGSLISLRRGLLSWRSNVRPRRQVPAATLRRLPVPERFHAVPATGAAPTLPTSQLPSQQAVSRKERVLLSLRRSDHRYLKPVFFSLDSYEHSFQCCS